MPVTFGEAEGLYSDNMIWVENLEIVVQKLPIGHKFKCLPFGQPSFGGNVAIYSKTNKQENREKADSSIDRKCTPVPEFGKWEGSEDAAYFEKTGKGENDNNTNLNGPGEKPPSEMAMEADVAPSDELKAVEPDGDSGKEGGRKSLGSDKGIGQTPLQLYQQANKNRISTRGREAASPSWERKGSYDNNVVSLTIRRTRCRSTVSSNENNEYASVPKFGDWDEDNPSSADRYSQIFEMVREEKLSGGAKVPTLWTETSNSSTRKRDTATIYQSCNCFPWSRK